MKQKRVAMDKDGDYMWHENKPKIQPNLCYWKNKKFHFELSSIFNIKPVKDWTKSLIEVGKCTR